MPRRWFRGILVLFAGIAVLSGYPQPAATVFVLSKPPSPAPAPTPTPEPTPTPTAKPTVTEVRRTSKPPTRAPSGVGVWDLASGSTDVIGPGTRGLKRYRVEAERATGLSPASVAAVVDATMADPRSWIAEGWAFQRVELPPSQVAMIVRVATPATVDRICLAYGNHTGGVVSCRAGKYLMLNLTRWNHAIPAYAGHVDQYRHLVVNHETGHVLGYGHASCPGLGRPAPVMMQQYFGLHGCVPNAWPYTADGTKIG